MELEIMTPGHEPDSDIGKLAYKIQFAMVDAIQADMEISDIVGVLTTSIAAMLVRICPDQRDRAMADIEEDIREAVTAIEQYQILKNADTETKN